MSLESENIMNVRNTYDAWHMETDELNTKLKIAERQRDEVCVLFIKKNCFKLIIFF